MMDFRANVNMVGKLLTGKGPQIVRDNQIAAMHDATQYGAKRVKERTPQGVFGAQGGLIGSIQPEVRKGKVSVRGIIGTASIYGLVVEKGRRPGKGMPPGSGSSYDIATREKTDGPLVRWIEVKMGVSREEALQIEYPVRRKIAQKGTEGAFMFEKTLDEDWPQFQNIFDRYGVKISRELER